MSYAFIIYIISYIFQILVYDNKNLKYFVEILNNSNSVVLILNLNFTIDIEQLIVSTRNLFTCDLDLFQIWPLLTFYA